MVDGSTFCDPGFERLGEKGNDLETLEREAVLVSLENLMTFPFVRDAVEAERLTLHGLYTEIGEGGLEEYDAKVARFSPV